MEIYSTKCEIAKLGNLPQIVPILLCDSEFNLHMQELCEFLVISGVVNFVCFGKNSEVVHDFIDDKLNQNSLSGITTWHVGETEQDVASFINVLPNFSKCNRILLVPLEVNELCGESILKFQKFL